MAAAGQVSVMDRINKHCTPGLTRTTFCMVSRQDEKTPRGFSLCKHKGFVFFENKDYSLGWFIYPISISERAIWLHQPDTSCIVSTFICKYVVFSLHWKEQVSI